MMPNGMTCDVYINIHIDRIGTPWISGASLDIFYPTVSTGAPPNSQAPSDSKATTQLSTWWHPESWSKHRLLGFFLVVSALPIHLIANQKYHTLSLHETKTHRLLNLKKVLFLRNNYTFGDFRIFRGFCSILLGRGTRIETGLNFQRNFAPLVLGDSRPRPKKSNVVNLERLHFERKLLPFHPKKVANFCVNSIFKSPLFMSEKFLDF